jgi:hypothetical protein
MVNSVASDGKHHSALTWQSCCAHFAQLLLQMRHLARELVAKERSIAALQASNRLHKQQLQQLAQSAVHAGLQVTPQRLLHIADEPNSPAGQDSGSSSSRYAALLEAEAASSPAPASPVTKHYIAAESPAVAKQQQQQHAGRAGSTAVRPASAASRITPLAGFMQGTGSPLKQQGAHEP